MAFDCYASFALPGTDAERVALRFRNLRKMGSWSIRLYGDDEALVMAKAWTHKHYFFLQAWQAAGCALERVPRFTHGARGAHEVCDRRRGPFGCSHRCIQELVSSLMSGLATCN